MLKIRGSYGTIGNDQIGGGRRFAYNTTLNTSVIGFNFGTNTPVGHMPPLTGITTQDQGNMNVSWEEATKADVGIELGLYDMIRIQADYFYEKREGIFIQRESQPSVVGTRVQQWVNLGRMQNQGFDMSLEFDKQINKDLYISARGNFTYNRTRKLYDDKPSQIWPYQNLAGFANNQQFGLIAEGLFASEEDIANWPKQDFGTVRWVISSTAISTATAWSTPSTAWPSVTRPFRRSTTVSVSASAGRASTFGILLGRGQCNAYHRRLQPLRSGLELHPSGPDLRRRGREPLVAGQSRSQCQVSRMSTTRMENNLQASTYWLRGHELPATEERRDRLYAAEGVDEEPVSRRSVSMYRV